MKKCKQCGLVKPLDKFRRNARGRNRAKCSSCHNKRVEEYRNRKYGPAYRDKRNDARRYLSLTSRGARLDKDEYDRWLEMLRAGPCAICGREDDLCIDHDHDTGIIRGILCRNCNRALGLIGDNLANVEKAVEYLKKETQGIPFP